MRERSELKHLSTGRKIKQYAISLVTSSENEQSLNLIIVWCKDFTD